jgi:hypothetical protein
MSEIQFNVTIPGPDGDDVEEFDPVTIEQLQAMIRVSDLQSIQKIIQKAAENLTKKLTLGRTCIIALDRPIKADEDAGLEAMMARGDLIDKIKDGLKTFKLVDLKSEDVTMIKGRVAKMFSSAHFVRRVCLMLEGKESGKETGTVESIKGHERVQERKTAER